MLGRIVLAILGGIALGFALAASGVLMALFGFIESIFGFTPEQISNVVEFFLGSTLMARRRMWQTTVRSPSDLP